MTDSCYVFDGAGGYMGWYFGYAKYLQENNDLSKAKFAGTSAGSIIATFLALDIPIAEAWREWLIPVVTNVGSFPNDQFGNIGRTCAQQLFTAGRFKRARSRLYISLTTSNLKRLSINKFNTVDELIDCILTSVHVPMLLDGTTTRTYQHVECMDGSFYNTMVNGDPYLPCRENCAHIRVKTPYKNYEQIYALSRFSDMDFHLENYRDGYLFAKTHINQSA